MSASFYASFVKRLDEKRRTELASTSDWEARVDAAVHESQQTWASAWLAPEEFAGELAARVNRDPNSLDDFLTHLRGADLYLACACAHGVKGALETFEQTYGGEILRSATRFEKPATSAEDLGQMLREKLFLSHAGGPPKIASYVGKGHLLNWLRVTMTRAFIDSTRSHAEPPSAPLADEILAALPGSDSDPELELLKRQHTAQFRAAFAEAVDALDPTDRHILRLHAKEHLSIDQIAAVHGIHRATAARRFVRVKEALLVATRAALGRRLGVSAGELDSILGLIASRLDASVERLLG